VDTGAVGTGPQGFEDGPTASGDRDAPDPDDQSGEPTNPGGRYHALSVVVPAFNEAKRLAESVARFDTAIAAGAVDPSRTEVVVVDDGSTDGTAELAERLLGHLPHAHVVRLESNVGKGGAIRAGIARSTGALVAFMDADMSIDPSQVPLLEEALRGNDVAIGSRTRPGSPEERPGRLRMVMGRAFTRAVNAATRVDLGDTQCGFKGFRAPAARLLFHLSVVSGYAFDVEVLSMARRLGLSIAEVPVHWRHIPGSRVRPLADAFMMARDVQRSRSGIRARPPIPGLSVADELQPSPDLVQVARGAAGPLLPVLARNGAGALILFPLCPEARRDEVAGHLRTLLPGASLHARSVSYAELTAMAPIHPLPTGTDPALPTLPGPRSARGPAATGGATGTGSLRWDGADS
jgi:Glycosyl transferase family 2